MHKYYRILLAELSRTLAYSLLILSPIFIFRTGIDASEYLDFIQWTIIPFSITFLVVGFAIRVWKDTLRLMDSYPSVGDSTSGHQRWLDMDK